MSDAPLMPKATAVWLVENTTLTFAQIAEFCRLHELEVQGIADGDVAGGIKGLNPVTSGQLTEEEIERGEADPEYRLKLAPPKVKLPQKKSRGPRYTPVSRRQDRPNAIKWLIRNHPELKDSQIVRLIGTTKNTIQAIRDGTHWNSAHLTPMDPVGLGLCSQIDLDFEVRKASRDAGGEGASEPTTTTLMPAEEAMRGREESFLSRKPESQETPAEKQDELDADAVFARLNSMKRKREDDDEQN